MPAVVEEFCFKMLAINEPFIAIGDARRYSFYLKSITAAYVPSFQNITRSGHWQLSLSGGGELLF